MVLMKTLRQLGNVLGVQAPLRILEDSCYYCSSSPAGLQTCCPSSLRYKAFGSDDAVFRRLIGEVLCCSGSVL